MNELRIFNNPEFGSVRTVTINGEYWFVGSDVARALGYSKLNEAVRTNTREMDTTTAGVIDSMGRTHQIKPHQRTLHTPKIKPIRADKFHKR